jgi:hypothetical protein
MDVVNGSADVTTYFVLRDSTNHVPKTDITITDIDLYYLEQGAAMAAKVDATALAAADSAHADNKAFHCGQGLYRVDWPDAAFDGGVGKTVQLIVVCTGVDTTFLEVELKDPWQTGDSYAIVNHADYGNAKLVRSTTPENTLTVDANHLVAVPTSQKVDVETIKTQAVTCGAGVTISPYVGNATAALVVDANGRVDLVKILGTAVTEGSAGRLAASFTKFLDVASPLGTINGIACSDKTGFALSATGADLILKSSTFVQAIVAAINEFATYGLTALNTLLTSTGIKAASIPDVQLAASQDHITPAVAGDKMDIVDAPSATGVGVIADAVWDETSTGHIDAGKAGQQLWTDINSILDDTGTSGVLVSGAGIDAIFDRNSSLSISFETLINRIYQMINDKMEITNESGDVVLRNIADSADIATGNVSDDSTTTTRDGLTWV